MWKAKLRLETIAGKPVDVTFRCRTRQECVSLLTRMGFKFDPTDFYGESCDIRESECMYMGEREAIFLTRVED